MNIQRTKAAADFLGSNLASKDVVVLYRNAIYMGNFHSNGYFYSYKNYDPLFMWNEEFARNYNHIAPKIEDWMTVAEAYILLMRK